MSKKISEVKMESKEKEKEERTKRGDIFMCEGTYQTGPVTIIMLFMQVRY